MTHTQAQQERQTLLWQALAKIVGAAFSAAIGVGIGGAILSGMEG